MDPLARRRSKVGRAYSEGPCTATLRSRCRRRHVPSTSRFPRAGVFAMVGAGATTGSTISGGIDYNEESACNMVTLIVVSRRDGREHDFSPPVSAHGWLRNSDRDSVQVSTRSCDNVSGPKRRYSVTKCHRTNERASATRFTHRACMLNCHATSPHPPRCRHERPNEQRGRAELPAYAP